MKAAILFVLPVILWGCTLDNSLGTGAGGSSAGGAGSVYLDQLPLAGSKGQVASRKTPKGTDLLIGDRKFGRGIGVQGNASVVIDLQGNAKSFSTIVGTDKEAGAEGMVRFYVIGDGRLLAESGIMKAADPVKALKADLTGIKQLVLRTDDVRSAGNKAFGNWADAAVQMVKGGPKVMPAEQAVPELQVWVDELDLTKASQGWQETGINVSAEYNPVTLKGKTFLHAVGTHPEGMIVIDLKGAAKSFSATVGIDDDADSTGTGGFTVIGDGKVLATSGKIGRDDPVKQIKVDLTGVKQLVLKVDEAEDGPNMDHTDWADALITLDPALAKNRPETVSTTLAKLPG